MRPHNALVQSLVRRILSGMGQAKHQQQIGLPADVCLATLSVATRKLFAAAGTQPGRDCYMHAALAQAVLHRLGARVELHVGYAAWRVDGEHPGAVIAHHPLCMAEALTPGQLMYHAWLRCGPSIIDLTTYQLRRKTAALDALDGQRTPVTWCPDFLHMPIADCVTYEAVANGRRAGLCHYRRVVDLERQLLACAPAGIEEYAYWLFLAYCAELTGPVRIIGPNTAENQS